MFRVSKRIATKKDWRCEVGDCKVTAISGGAQVVKNPDTAAHCHPSEDLEIKRKDFRHSEGSRRGITRFRLEK